MGLILLEALGAGIVFILIIWWTMFSGRKRGELRDDADAEDTPASGDKRIRIVNQRYSNEDMVALVRDADCVAPLPPSQGSSRSTFRSSART